MKNFTDSLGKILPYLLCVGLFIGYQEYRDYRDPDKKPTAGVDGKALGQAYAPASVQALADGWLAAAAAVENGKPVADCQAAMQAAWKVSRERSFEKLIAPDFRLVLDEGTEPTATQRTQVARVWRDFAAGLIEKGGAK